MDQRGANHKGNLGFKTTAQDVVEHFKETVGCTPQVRLLTEKSTRPTQQPKSRGIAFLEVPTGEAMQAALKMHHTTLHSRRINVELTAGGGGKTEARQNKISERNERVGVQRGKRAEKEKEEREKNGEKVEEENVNGYKPEPALKRGEKREIIKTRGPDVGQKPMRAWGVKSGSEGVAGGAAPRHGAENTGGAAVPHQKQDMSHVAGVADGSVKVRNGRRVKVNPAGQAPRRPPAHGKYTPTGANAMPVN